MVGNTDTVLGTTTVVGNTSPCMIQFKESTTQSMWVPDRKRQYYHGREYGKVPKTSARGSYHGETVTSKIRSAKTSAILESPITETNASKIKSVRGQRVERRQGFLRTSGETGGQIPRSVLRVMRVHAQFASHYRDAALSAGASKTGGQLQMKQFVPDGLSVGSRCARSHA